MTTPASGSISFSEIRNELDWNTSFSLGGYRPRLLANKSTGTIKSSDLYNKTAIGHSFSTLLTLSGNEAMSGSAYLNGNYFYSKYNGTVPGNASYLYRSSTGTSFSQVASITTTSTAYATRYQGILYGGGVYVAYGTQGFNSGGSNYGSPIVQYSTDGNTFTTAYAPQTPGQPENNITYGAYGNGRFLLSGSAGQGDTFVWAPDWSPSSWTNVTSRPSGSRLYLTFEQDAFFLVAQETTSPYNRYLYRSVDGSSWTAIISYGASAQNFNVFHNGTYYIASFMDTGAASQLRYFVSPDGISWTSLNIASTPAAPDGFSLVYCYTIKTIPQLGAYFMSAANTKFNTSSGQWDYVASVWRSTDMANWSCVFQSPTTNKYCGEYFDTNWTGLATMSNGGGGVLGWYYGDSTGYYINLSATGSSNFVNKQNNLGSEYVNYCLDILGFTSDNSKPLVGVMQQALVISQR